MPRSVDAREARCMMIKKGITMRTHVPNYGWTLVKWNSHACRFVYVGGDLSDGEPADALTIDDSLLWEENSDSKPSITPEVIYKDCGNPIVNDVRESQIHSAFDETDIMFSTVVFRLSDMLGFRIHVFPKELRGKLAISRYLGNRSQAFYSEEPIVFYSRNYPSLNRVSSEEVLTVYLPGDYPSGDRKLALLQLKENEDISATFERLNDAFGWFCENLENNYAVRRY